MSLPDAVDARATRPLSGLQQMMLRWEQLHPYNAVQMLRLKPGAASVDDVKRGVQMAFSELGFTRLTFDRRLRHVTLSSDDRPPEPEVIETDEVDLQWIEQFFGRELNRPFTLDDDLPIRLFDIRAGGSDHFLALTYRHAISDALGIVRLAQRLVAHCYQAESAGHPFEWRLQVPSMRSVFHKQRWRWRQLTRLKRAITEVVWHRSCFAVPLRNPNDWQFGFRVHHQSLPTQSLTRIAKRHGVTVQELLIATTMEAIANTVRRQQHTRRDIAVTTMVDLRRHADAAADDETGWLEAFGQFLGSFTVKAACGEESSFDALVAHVAHMSRQSTKGRDYLSPAIGLESMAKIWDRLPRSVNAVLGRNVLPVAAGISNVDLTGPAAEAISDGVVTDCFRATGLGVIVPLMVTLTTCGPRFNLTSTWRTACFETETVDRIMDHVAQRLTDEPATVSAPVPSGEVQTKASALST